MVALGGFFLLFDISVQFVFTTKAQAVNALEHGAFFVPAPIGPGNAGELKIGNFARVFQVRAAAQIGIVAVDIYGNGAVLQFFQQFQFIRFAAFGKKFFRFRFRHFFALKRLARLDDFFHLGFNFFQVFRRELGFAVKIIIKAIINGRADTQFCTGEQLLYCLRQNVSARMTHNF